MRYYLKITYILMLATVGLVSCKDTKNEELNSTSSGTSSPQRIAEMEFPTTSIDRLTHDTSLDEDINCPVAARYAALYELLEGGYMMLNDLHTEDVYVDGGQENPITNDNYMEVDWTLTNTPRAIYDFDGKVKYYEFGLVKDNEVTSTITVYARREAPRAIAFMFPYVLPYENTNYDYYVGRYPHRVFHDGTGYRDVEDTENTSYLSLDSLSYWNQIYAQLDSEETALLDNLRSRADSLYTDYETEAEEYWDNVATAIDEISNDLDIESPCVSEARPPKYIENTYIEHLKTYLGTSSYCRDYTARSYCSTPLQQTFWYDACGPSALAWVYRGLRNTYPIGNGAYLPLHGDGSTTYFYDGNSNYSFYHYNLEHLNTLSWTRYNDVKDEYIQRSDDVDNGLTANFYSRCLAVKYDDMWQFIMWPWNLDGAFEAATNGYYTIHGDCWATTAADWIFVHNLPVLILSCEGADAWHYIVAYGYGGISDTPGGDIQRSNLYFLVTDNGNKIRAHQFKPFWRHYQKHEFYHRVDINW